MVRTVNSLNDLHFYFPKKSTLRTEKDSSANSFISI
jgi:hypothetical protein